MKIEIEIEFVADNNWWALWRMLASTRISLANKRLE